MKIFKKIGIKDIVFVAGLFYIVASSIYTETTFSFYRGGSASLLTEPVLYYVYLTYWWITFVGYVLYIIFRNEKL